MTIWHFESNAFRGMELHECVYGDNVLPQEMAYGPQCSALNRTGGGSIWVFPDAEGERYGFTVATLWGLGEGGQLPDSIGKRGYGLWFYSRGIVDRMVTHGLFFSW